ncbi:transforming growth factor beta activator LRRC33-like [Engraulis encrasicolus]|uniref:transforming growth factor beta activator LRRC33-like n=1 Tax=Engraulis encrasicolus TaxID=184585 RepID=UPI002FCEA666
MSLHGNSYRLLNSPTDGTHTGVKRESWSHRNLSSVPWSLDERLIDLDLSNNVIKNFKMINLQLLERLDVSYNHLSLIYNGAFKNLVRLHELNLASNLLNNNIMSNSQAFKDLRGLRSLDISSNNLDGEAVKQFLNNAASSLDSLTVTGNVVSKLTAQFFANTKNLRVINLERNLISKIEEGTFDHLKKLTELNLAQNNLAFICNFKLSQVIHLNLSRNSLEFFITHENENVHQLEVLDLSYNNLLYFPILPKHNHLTHLHLQNNRLGALTRPVSEARQLYEDVTNSKNYTTDDKLFAYADWHNMSLIYLDLSRNLFRSFPLSMVKDPWSLQILNMSGNCLHNISVYSFGKNDQQSGLLNYSLPSLRHISLQDNNVHHLPPTLSSTFPKIERIVLGGNRIRPCPVETTGLSEVQCASFSNITTLKHLDLQDNNLKLLLPGTFADSPLISLDLSANKHLTIAKNALWDLENTLESLSIGGNNMTDSQFGLSCMDKMKFLNVSHNNVKNLPVIATCSPLMALDVRNNSLSSLANVTVSLLSVIYISGNSFNCCEATWLQSLNEANVTIPDLNSTECLHPVKSVIPLVQLQDVC